MNKCYLEDLSHLEELMTSVPVTPYITFSKIISLVALNMRYEAMAFSRDVDDHPYILTSKLIRDSMSQFQMLVDNLYYYIFETGNIISNWNFAAPRFFAIFN